MAGVDAQRAEVVGEHHAVLKALGDLALGPDALRVRPAEELVGDGSVVVAQPVREGPIG